MSIDNMDYSAIGRAMNEASKRAAEAFTRLGEALRSVPSHKALDSRQPADRA